MREKSYERERKQRCEEEQEASDGVRMLSRA